MHNVKYTTQFRSLDWTHLKSVETRTSWTPVRFSTGNARVLRMLRQAPVGCDGHTSLEDISTASRDPQSAWFGTIAESTPRVSSAEFLTPLQTILTRARLSPFLRRRSRDRRHCHHMHVCCCRPPMLLCSALAEFVPTSAKQDKR